MFILEHKHWEVASGEMFVLKYYLSHVLREFENWGAGIILPNSSDIITALQTLIIVCIWAVHIKLKICDLVRDPRPGPQKSNISVHKNI